MLSVDEYASFFENIDPVSQYKMWTTKQAANRNSHSTRGYNVSSERVKATFVVSDPVDWGRDIQVLPHSVMDLWTVSSLCITVFHLEASSENYFLFNLFFVSGSLFSSLFRCPSF